MKLIIANNSEKRFILNHDQMMKGLIESSDLIRVLYVNINSWIKHFLYDPSIRFDMFSTFEIQLIFLSFLNTQNLVKISPG